jgi:hypothetical protein
VEDARAWVDRDERLRDLPWTFQDEWIDQDDAPTTDPESIERDEEATKRYLAFAKEQHLPPNSPELFRLAHERGIIESLALFDGFGCTGRLRIVQSYLSDWNILGLDWTPSSCMAYGLGTVYAAPNKGGRNSRVAGPVCIDLPFSARAVEPL